MKKQTAVEWLKQQYIQRGDTLPSGVFEDAKKIEEEQHIESYNDGYRDGELDGLSCNKIGKDISEFSNAKLYFKEKYKRQ